MSQWNPYRMIDILSEIDLPLLEEGFPDGDVENPELFPREKQRWSRRRIAVISGLAAGSAAVLTGIVVLMTRKNGLRSAA